MAVYRFLFAPVLLAVGVLIGARERAATVPPPAPPAAETRPAPAAAGPAVPGPPRTLGTQAASVR